VQLNKAKVANHNRLVAERAKMMGMGVVSKEA